MRNALFVFLLLNLLAFAYQKWVLGPDESVEADFLEQGFPALAKTDTPAEEAPQTSEPTDVAEEVTVEVAAVASVNLVCKRIGPFSREEDANKALQALESGVDNVSLSAETGEVWAGFWVQVPASADLAAVKKTQQKLVNAGMQDAYIISDSGKHSISLGVFRLTQSAGKVIAQASALGIQTDIRDRYEQGSNYWLNVSMSGEEELPTGLWQAKSSPILRTETVICDASDA